ncbi:MAG TPA: hypothetical protein PKC43_07175 [Phycisphaerales bacterium]|nr:hypothetical protein [Phycisphaerales bacterium]HMP37216.1 hypothetical protein [Phycisphaerales bacterium]
MRCSRRTTQLGALVALNGALLGALAFVTLSPIAAGQGERARAQYMVTSGTVKGSESAVIWVIDQTNQDLVAMTWNVQQSRLEGVGYRDLRIDAAAALRGSRN